MNTQKKILAVVVVAIVLALGVTFPRGNSIVERITGAVPTLDGVDSPFVSINGVRDGYVSSPLIATSSTICSLDNPYSATTSVDRITLEITDGILGANNFSISTSTNNYATSTQHFILDENIPSETTGFWAWTAGYSTTSARIIGWDGGGNTTGKSPFLVGPNEKINIRLATTTGAGALADYYDGRCSTVFMR